MSSREIQRLKGDRIKINLPEQYRQILLDLHEMAVTHLLAESPVTKRIFPTAYRNSPEMEMDYQRLTRESLTKHHQQQLTTFEQTIFKTEITMDEALSWVGALNDMRLILGTALDVNQEHKIPEENDPNYEGFVVYDFLTYLQEAILEAMQS